MFQAKPPLTWPLLGKTNGPKRSGPPPGGYGWRTSDTEAGAWAGTAAAADAETSPQATRATADTAAAREKNDIRILMWGAERGKL
ncbi:hypothetical protein GCM10009730_07150 [Streptomyces albidochromogenes]